MCFRTWPDPGAIGQCLKLGWASKARGEMPLVVANAPGASQALTGSFPQAAVVPSQHSVHRRVSRTTRAMRVPRTIRGTLAKG